jgi:hypothetical protein
MAGSAWSRRRRPSVFRRRARMPEDRRPMGCISLRGNRTTAVACVDADSFRQPCTPDGGHKNRAGRKASGHDRGRLHPLAGLHGDALARPQARRKHFVGETQCVVRQWACGQFIPTSRTEHVVRCAMRRCENSIDNASFVRRRAFNMLDVRKLRHRPPPVQCFRAYRKTSGVLGIFLLIRDFIPTVLSQTASAIRPKQAAYQTGSQ